jgi:L-alanine-DL-glutamate epimerase-like enolase superfamily enzyme
VRPVRGEREGTDRLSRREFLAAAGVLAAGGVAGAAVASPLPRASSVAPRAATASVRIGATALEFEREPLIRPSGFKGGYMTEFWQVVARMESDAGQDAVGLGTQNVLWCDPEVLAAFSESGANSLMLAVTDRALQMVRGESFGNPIELLERILPELQEYARRIAGMPALNPTFVLNALVPFDNAAWLLYARANGISTFDELIPERFRPGLSYRHRAVASLPSVTYGLPLSEVEQAAADGYFVIKLKLGHPGTQAEMLEQDMARLTQIHRAVGSLRTPHTRDGRVRYDLDPNSRYERKETLLRLLDHARRIGALDQIVVVEEPFPYENEEEVGDIAIPIAADESATTEADAIRRFDLGYRGMALKAIAKTLSETIRIAQLCHERGIACMAADLTVNPILVDWNKNVAARLAPFPGMDVGMMETNGHQQYRDWARMESYHPCADAPWRRVRGGVFEVDEDFYRRSGCVLERSEHYEGLVGGKSEG